MQLTAKQVWHAIEKELFAVIGMVTANIEARTSGVVYMGRDLSPFSRIENNG
jgi:hypothetical protein